MFGSVSLVESRRICFGVVDIIKYFFLFLGGSVFSDEYFNFGGFIVGKRCMLIYVDRCWRGEKVEM